MASQPPPQNPILGFVLLASVVGFIIDWRYKRKGGKRPTKTDYIILAIIVVVVFGGIAVLNHLNYNAEILVDATIPLVIWIFGMWEFSRWRTRNKNPIPPAQEQPKT